MNESILLTPASLLDFLSSIDELKDKDIGITETLDGNIQCQIGDSFYEIDCSGAETVEVESDTVDQVDDINESAYEELDDSYDRTEGKEEVSGGIIKEVLKTLLVGGLVRLSATALK